MEYQKILNLLNEANESKSVTRKWKIVNNQSYGKNGERNEVIYNTEVLRSNLSDYNNFYILVKDDIAIKVAPTTQVSFKNWALFTKCMTDIGGATIDDTEDLDLVMSMCNVIEYSSNYSETTRSLWLYTKDEVSDFKNNVANTNDFKSFKYKTKLLGNTVAQPDPNQANGILQPLLCH